MDVPPGKASQRRFRFRRYGVYDLTYEDAASPPFDLRIHALLDWFQVIFGEIPYVGRQLVVMIKLAPVEFVAYVVTAVWLGIYSAINLYWLNVLFDTLVDGFIGGVLPSEVYWFIATSWASCAMVNVAAGRIHARALEILAKRSGRYFVPHLIHASMRVELLSIQDLCTVFPIEGRFGSEYPGSRFLKQLSWLVQSALGLTSEVFVLLHAVSRKRSPEREVLLCFCVVRACIWWFAPPNGIGCSAYIYWSNNWHFQRMKVLFGLAFSTKYRADLLLDGIASSIEIEYMKSADQIGDVEILDPTPWRVELLRDWYWDFLVDMTLNLPLAIYALLLRNYLTPSTIASMALMQQANRSISLSIAHCTEDTLSLLDICSSARRLYNAVNYQSTMMQGREPFPRVIDNFYDAGTKISFRKVSLRYPGSEHHALRDVSFDILPGELVLLVGTNGSGKSSMLKLLARLFDPTAGKIFVDDLPLVHYDMDQFRSAVAFQSQSPVVYPATVKENIAFGLSMFDVKQEHVEEAARMGSCSEWIAKLGDGYDTQLQPTFDIHGGWMDGIYGYPSDALKEALARHQGRPVSISGGEKQRLATARTLMRIHHRTTRLVVVDEATSSLDPVAERDILTEFRNARAGKTMILVTHRFHHLAHETDRILCMKDGRVVESGTHAQLVRADGEYAALYRAQVG